MESESFNLLATIKSFFSDGGPYMYIILLVWITGLGLSVYKYFMLKRNDIKNNKLFDLVKGNVLKNDVEAAINLCSNSKAVLPKILRSGLKRANEERQLVEDALSTSIMEHAPPITYHLSYISLAANISTLIGLLGTIQGLIISFSGVAGADPGEKARILAEGIAKAMNTTAFGLISAITIMVLHTILTNKAIRINDKIDEISGKLLDLLSIKRRKQEQ
jgi:biopolymer transport protein ExbB